MTKDYPLPQAILWYSQRFTAWWEKKREKGNIRSWKYKY